MAEKKIDLGLDPLHTHLTVFEAKEAPCFGQCGRSWDDAEGGWFEFEQSEETGGPQLAPRWFCDECSKKRSAEEDKRGCLKDDSDTVH